MARLTTGTVAAEVPQILRKLASAQEVGDPVRQDIPVVSTIFGPPKIPSGTAAVARSDPRPTSIPGSVNKKEKSTPEVLKRIS
jgi:hypothetical protein